MGVLRCLGMGSFWDWGRGVRGLGVLNHWGVAGASRGVTLPCRSPPVSEVKSRGLGCLCPPRSSLLGSLNPHFHHRGSVQAQTPPNPPPEWAPSPQNPAPHGGDPQNPGAQGGTSSHRCVQAVYGGGLCPTPGCPCPVLGAGPFAATWVGFWGAVTSQGLSGQLTPVISVGRSRPNS